MQKPNTKKRSKNKYRFGSPDQTPPVSPETLTNQPGGNIRRNPRIPKSPITGFFRQTAMTLLLVLLLTVLAGQLFEARKTRESKQISVGELVTLIHDSKVSKLQVDGTVLTATLIDKTEKIAHKESSEGITELLIHYGVTDTELQKLDVQVTEQSGGLYWVAVLGPILLPILFIFGFIWFLSVQMKGSGMKAFNFGQSRARMANPDKNRITFADVAGNAEAKRELEEVVDFLKNPRKYLDMGAKIPRGVLLTGAPGTGKTLLARAVAGEANAPFFHLSGSEFVEMFVGVGASRVRDLFVNAKKEAPAIVFIDEIDAVGRSRGVGMGGGNDEREQTLNQILVEMDGFEPSDAVIVIAATNRADVLDEALLRPGRFDRRVILDLPDRIDRLAILQIHSRNKKLADDVHMERVAERTPGFSGADLDSIMNEAAILAAREDKTEISQDQLYRSIEKVMMGPERTSHKHTEHERRVVAYHEAGHAIVSSVLPHADPVHKVTIIARGHAGGYTLKLPLEEKHLTTRAEYLDDIAMAMGGYAAEELVFGDITTGPSGDLQSVTSIARTMVTRWGMSDVIGPVALESGDGKIIIGMGVNREHHSESVSALIDSEVRRIVSTALERAREVLAKYRDALDAVANKLLEVEVLEESQYNEIIKQFGIEPKREVSI